MMRTATFPAIFGPLALTALLLLAACNPAAPTRASIAGTWVGEARGVRIQLDLVERATIEPTIFEVTGSGFLTILATAEMLPLTVVGSTLSSGIRLLGAGLPRST